MGSIGDLSVKIEEVMAVFLGSFSVKEFEFFIFFFLNGVCGYFLFRWF